MQLRDSSEALLEANSLGVSALKEFRALGGFRALSGASVTDAGTNVSWNVLNSSGSYASIYMTANGVNAQQYVGAGVYFLGTNSAHAIVIGADRFNAGNAIVVDLANNVGFYGSTYSASDTRLKDEQKVVDTTQAMEVLRSIDAKTYTRNDRKGESRIGFVAQEVEAALPEGWGNIVSQLGQQEEETATYDPPLKSLDYARLTSVLWQCCKDLDSRVRALEVQLAKPEASKKRKAS